MIKRLPGACNADTGIVFPDETLQHGLFSAFTWNAVPADFALTIEGQCGPQHLGAIAESPRRQAPNADRPLARRMKASITATSLYR
jgi:hypothetical protein